ncbi:flagellar motor switch protein FliN [Desulfuromonas acetoxidans]|uniref:Flagellar motor switch protein FliN n=1 Tax=Desulfuromonas acetoxidans (strain DSM 684 / 11070) TaxID=281689 RepID=Q1JZS6_DESA6|nr:flagellar motor switch protein FliN [Desulfuromonas acetoxidans]EAT15816.1 Flagellar motor switch FliN [Desulfuromonas acetoxidans DSM 684]MBF0644982.1 flagellar motor switch protein FliN [Desulfuromonas acetoxidans]NVD25639.1 flagellar motor switch protein FliN [Desulfuromonas acetoxidans]NVE17691.1 flagellar motor switch protein FliN [Desulfuromonas acetoxidans]
MEETEATPAPAPDAAESHDEDLKNLELLLDIPLDVSVEVGRTKILVRELLQMDEGYVIELGKNANEPLDVYVNSRLIARGEVVLVDDKLGLRLTDVISPAERIEKLA